MDISQFLDKLFSHFNHLNINIEETQPLRDKLKKQFLIYQQYLQQTNQMFNLTRLDKDEIIFEQYFWESLIPFIGMDLNHKKLLDIGSGSGIPGIVLKLIFDQMDLTIIESNQKRVKFMQTLVEHLGLKNVSFYNIRAESAPKNLYEQFDVVTSRAVAKLKILLEISAPFCKLNGLIVEPKSTNYQTEINEVDNQFLVDLGLQLNQIKYFNDNSNKPINTIIYQKQNHTHSIYPRLWKDIIK